MAFILADVLDTSLRQALLMGDGNPLIIVSRPLSGAILALTVAVLGLQFVAFRRGVLLETSPDPQEPA